VVEELLDLGTRRRVCVVIGAAGWGKTTTVSSWASGSRVAWVRRDGDERSSKPVLDDINEALRPHVPVPVLPHRPRPSAAERGGLEAGDLCDWLRTHLPEDLVLVVDDLQELRPGSDDSRLLDGLCRHAPDRLHLVLISRQEPPFSLRRLRGQGLVAEISATELALDDSDIAALLGSTIGETPPGLAVRLWERTGGWPAVVNSAVELLRGIEPDQRLGVLEHLTRPGERLHDYLAEEVVGREPGPVRELLRRLAICGEAGSRTRAGDVNLLADLTRRGLVRRGSGDGVRWSLVRPLRDYFDHEAVLPPGDRAALHIAAGKECVARDAPGEALRHLVAAGEHAHCVALLREHGSALVSGGQVAAVLEAAKLPAEYLNDPSIQRVLGEARQVAGQSAAAQECFRRAGNDSDVLESALAWRMAQIAFMQGDFDEVREVYRRTRLAAEDTADEALMLVLVAMTCRMIGDLVSFRGATVHAVAAARRCGEPRVWAAVHSVLAVQAGAEGDPRRAEVHWANALGSATACNDLLQISFIRHSQAAHMLEFGLPRQALAEAQTALQVSERCENLFLTAQALTTRGRAHTRLGVLEAAVADLATAVELFQRIGSRLLAWPLCGLGDVHRTRGQLARARAAYEEALALAEPCHDVLGMGTALTGLARVRAADDPTVARALAERAVALRDGLREVPAMLARGWVALQAGDRQTASSDAALAVSAAGLRRDNPGLAEALMLAALASDHPGADSTLFGQAIDIWHEAGCLVDEAIARIVTARVGAPLADLRADLAHQTLRKLGVDVAGRGAGPLGAVRQRGPSVSVRTLGAFQVMRDGVPIPKAEWQSKKARDLLKVLVTRRRPVHREQLMELLWPDTDIAKSGNRLSVLLSMVRDVLQPQRDGHEPLATDGNSVWLDPQQVTIDVEEFLAQASLALDAHGRRARDATARLIGAEAGYTGDFLEDDPYQEWAQSLAEEVRATHVALLRALTRRLREAGDVDGVVRYTLRLLAHDGYDERAHLDLVAVQLEAGHFGEARRRYRLYAQRMKELQVVPRPMPIVRR
jgi:DNA-binding SARP family transcriptional activator/tetratricopeptide (TPR) repeat protein